MKRAFASIAGLVGLAALGRFIAKRRHPAGGATASVDVTTDDALPAATVPPDTTADPAEELRRKLADARGAGVEPGPSAPQEAPDETLEERRARVHAMAREAIDSMGADPTGNGGAPS